MSKRPKGEQKAHIEKVGNYVGQLAEEGKMKSAQPLKPQGAIVSKKDDKMVHIHLDFNREVISGYYHIEAFDLDEAIKIAKSDPRFEDGDWKIEVRPFMKVDGIGK